MRMNFLISTEKRIKGKHFVASEIILSRWTNYFWSILPFFWLLFLLNLPRSPTPFSLTREEKVTITSKTSLVLSSLQICIQILLHISVLFPKNRPECPSDKYTQCFLEVTATIGTCALGIVGSLTIEGWFSVSFLTRYLPTPILKLSVFVIHSLTYRLLPALMRSMALNMIVMDVFVIFLNGFVITHVIYQ